MGRRRAHMTAGPPPGGCVVPMWDSKNFICAEASKVDAEWEDANGVTRKALENRDACTVECPSFWKSADVKSMVCKSGKFKSDEGDKVFGIQCRTSKRVYLAGFAVVVI